LARSVAPFERRAALGRSPRCPGDIGQIEDKQHADRADGAEIDVLDGQRLGDKRAARELRLDGGALHCAAEQDQHDRGRQDGAERPGGADDPGGERPVISRLQHRRQRQEPDGQNRGAHRAGGRRQQHGDDEGGDAEPAGTLAEQRAQAFQQIRGEGRALQDDAEIKEQRHRLQQVVFHQTGEAERQRRQQPELEQAEEAADKGESDRRADQGEGDRKAEHQQQEDRAEHGDAHHLRHDKAGHFCRKINTLLATLAKDWRPSKAARTSKRAFIRK